MNRTDCPSVDTLSDFLLGKLEDADLTTVAEHLDVCTECEQMTGRLEGASDPVVSQLRRISGPDAYANGDSSGYAGGAGGFEIPMAVESWGEFKIVREIGRGGMGVVYEAFQGSLNRHVALKFLPERGNVARFRREAQAAGRLHHTNIVPVFGVGEHRGRHFYVMQYIVGRGLDAVSKERAAAKNGSERSTTRSSARETARIGAQVAGALAYAHGQGVIHRDIKPSNLLLDDQGTVWITDFGLAKLTDQKDLTGTGDFVGTVRYMPPEAFEGRYDARGDIYALGLTLYELLALRPAFDETDRAQVIRQVMAGDPPRLRQIDGEVPRDLEVVIHKAIERDPNHRYQTAAALAEDLKRFIEDRPIRARRVSEGEKFTRWCRRNPTPASLLAALVLVFWLGFGLVAWNWREAVIEREAKEKQVVKALEAEAEASAASDRARGEEKKALEAAEVAGRRLYSSLIDRARLEHQAANIAEAEAVLDRCEPARRSWEWHFLKGLNNAQIFTLRGHEGRVEQAVFSPDGEWIATAGGGNPWFESPGEKVVPATVVLWDAKSGRPVHTLRSHTHQISQVVFIGNGSLLASGGHRGDIHIHEVATGRLLRTIATGHSIRTLATSSVGRRLATEAGDAVISWDIDTGAGSALLPKIPNGYFPIAYSPDGRWLASLMGTSAVRLWDAGTMTEAAWPEHPTGYIAVAISPDSRFLAGGSVNGLVSVWNLGDGKLRQTLSGHQGWVWALDFSADGRYLASVGQDRTVRVWDAESGSLVRVIRGHTDTVTDVAFSPDGDRLVTASHDGTARVWDLTLNPETGAPEFLQLPVIMPIDAISYARGGSEQRTFTRTGRVFRYAVGSLCRLGEISTGIDVSLRTPFEPASFDSGGDSVVAVDHRSGREAIWHELNGGGRRTTLRGHTLEIQFATLSADGTRAATAASAAPPESPGEVFVWDAAAGTVLHRREVNGEKIHRISLDPTGKLLAVSAEWNAPTGDRRGSLPAPFVSVIEVDTGREVLHRETRGDRCQALGFSGDGRRLAAAGGDRAVLIWDLGAGTAALESRQGPPSAMDLAFSPDGLRLAVASRQQVKLMDTATAEEVLTLRGRAQIVSNSHGFNPRVRFSPDGHELIAICDDSADLLAIWSSSRDTPANQQKRDSAARRRAVTRHLALADTLDWRHPPDRRTALYHLGFAERIGLESPEEFLAKGVIQSTHGSWAAAEAALNRAIALAPRDNQTLTAAALIASRYGRFDRAALWYDRIPNVTALLSSAELDEQAAGFFIRDDLARYQQFCAESVKRFDSDQTSPWNASVMAYNLSLGADPGLEAVEPLRIAQQVYQHMANSTADNRARSWALTALGAAHVRAGFPERAEPFFREAEKIILEQELGPILATWMAITTWQQGRRDEARAWLAKTDRFVSERVKNAPTELEGRPPEGFNPGHWWRIRIAQREAQHLILDSEFPADPFAR